MSLVNAPRGRKTRAFLSNVNSSESQGNIVYTFNKEYRYVGVENVHVDTSSFNSVLHMDFQFTSVDIQISMPTTIGELNEIITGQLIDSSVGAFDITEGVVQLFHKNEDNVLELSALETGTCSMYFVGGLSSFLTPDGVTADDDGHYVMDIVNETYTFSTSIFNVEFLDVVVKGVESASYSTDTSVLGSVSRNIFDRVYFHDDLKLTASNPDLIPLREKQIALSINDWRGKKFLIDGAFPTFYLTLILVE